MFKKCLEEKPKRLLLLGGSQWKDAIKQFATDYNVTLLATGNDQSAGIFDIADERYHVNSTDSRAMKQLIKDAHADGVYMGGSETVINSACKYLNELHLPCYCTQEQWKLFQNKHRFKQLLKKHGLPVCPEYYIDSKNIERSVPNNEYPVILKPADGCGSSGFSVCHTPNDLQPAFKHAVENSPTGTVICEKFVRNQGVVIFYSFSNGKVYYAGAEDKYPVLYKKQGSYVAGLFVFESKFVEELRSKYETKLIELFNDVGLKEGSLWIEVFHDGDNWYFNEAGYRYGGSISIYPVDYIHNINQVYRDLYFALTGKSKCDGFRSLIPDNIERGKKYGVYAVHANEGILNEYKGKTELEENKNIIKVFLTKPEHTRIESTGSFSQVVALIHFLFSSESEIRTIVDLVHSVFRVEDETGNNLVNKMLSLNRIQLSI